MTITISYSPKAKITLFLCKVRCCDPLCGAFAGQSKLSLYVCSVVAFTRTVRPQRVDFFGYVLIATFSQTGTKSQTNKERKRVRRREEEKGGGGERSRTFYYCNAPPPPDINKALEEVKRFRRDVFSCRLGSLWKQNLSDKPLQQNNIYALSRLGVKYRVKSHIFP